MLGLSHLIIENHAMTSASNVVQLRQNYQIKILLNHTKPPIWRRLIVDSRITLDALHDAIQISMGWSCSHLHQFVDRNNVTYNLQDDESFMLDFGQDAVDESLVLLNELLKKEKDWLRYEYDFGDGWDHKIILEKILPHKKDQFPVLCIKGVRACPPEDCGGPWGYQHILKQLSGQSDEVDDDLLDWLGDDFDPLYFNLDEVNAVLREIFDEVSFNGKTGLEGELQRISEDSDLLGNDMLPADLLADGQMPDEMKDALDGMQEAVAILAYMDDLLEQSAQAFKKIQHLSKEKKIIAIAKKMTKLLDD